MKKKYIKPAISVSCFIQEDLIMVVSLPQDSVDDITVGSREFNNGNWYDDDEL